MRADGPAIPQRRRRRLTGRGVVPATLLALITLTMAGDVARARAGSSGQPGAPAAATGLRRALRGYPVAFTHPPAAIGDVKEILPLGNFNGDDHIIPVDHMYLGYPHGATAGADTVQIAAMAAGEVVMVARRHEAAVPVPDMSIWIRHSPRLTSQYEHVHELAGRVATHLASTGAGWIAVNPDFEIMFLGQLGAPEPLDVTGGEIVGATHSYSQYWDVGVIDAGARGTFVGDVSNRYPTLAAFAGVLGIPLDHAPFAGQATLNAGCFLRYMEPGLAADWSALLVDPPGACGRCDWDLDGRLRGTWFNPALDTSEPPPLFEREWAALPIVPYNLDPATRVQIAVPSGHPLAAVDPVGAYPQLRRRFVVEVDRASGARVNPDPVAVGPETGTVCYDLRYPDAGGDRFNALLLRLSDPRTLQVALDPTPAAASRCSLLLAAGEPAWNATYVR